MAVTIYPIFSYNNQPINTKPLNLFSLESKTLLVQFTNIHAKNSMTEKSSSGNQRKYYS